MTTLSIRVEDLSYQFRGTSSPALDGINLSIPSGQICGLIGPDGAGKTTLLRLIAGLLTPAKGQIFTNGHSAHKSPAIVRRHIGYMPQQLGLYEDLSVQENLHLYADLRGVTGTDRQTTIDRLYTFTGLGPFRTRLAGQLSGGMKQKLGLACALIKKPKTLLLDEPSVGVDPLSRRDLFKLVQSFTSGDTTIIWSTAYLDEAEQFDSVFLLSEGNLLYAGKPHRLTHQLKDRVAALDGLNAQQRRASLAQLLDSPNVLDGTVQGQSIRLLLRQGADLQSLQETPLHLPLRPLKPRFEDAFMDLLGGISSGRSSVAEHYPQLPASCEPVVTAQHLTKLFGSFKAVDAVNLTIPRGQIYGLLGPNGAGKSTTFKMLCGLLPPSQGEGTVAGIDLLHAPAMARNRLGYMAQKFSLYGDLSVNDNLTFFARAYGLSGAKCNRAVSRMLNAFALQPYAATPAAALPLGFKQRLSLASALMHEPDILFLDEPTSGVDPITRREFWNHINSLVLKGVTILVTTHFMDEAEYCDRIAFIFGGRKIAEGSPDQLKERARTATCPTPTMEDAFIHLVQNGHLQTSQP